MAYDGFYLTYKSDRETNERFDRVREKYPNFRMVKINLEDWSDPKIDKAIMKIADVANTKHFWIIDPDVNVDDNFNFNFETDSWDDNVVHVWNAEERNVFRSVVGVKLFKTSDVKKKKTQYIQDAYFLTGEFKEHKSNQVEYKPTTETYDIFYWKKDYGNANFEKLKERFPEIKTVEGDTNIDVHEMCRKAARTDFYYLIHPNTEIFDTFNFDYSFAFGLDKENQKVVVWQKENPKTGLVREYHGVGLFPKDGPMFKESEYAIFNFRRKAVYEKDPIARDLEFPVIRTTDMHKLDHTVDADMYWLVHEDVEEFETDFYPFSYDREFIHNFNVVAHTSAIARNLIRLVPVNWNEEKQKDVAEIIGDIKEYDIISSSTLKGGLAQIKSYPTLIVDPAVELDSFNFYPDLYDEASAHVFPDGVVLVTKEYDEYNIKFHEDKVARIPDYPIYFWDRGYNKSNYEYLKEKLGERLIKVTCENASGVHSFAIKNSDCNYYYVIKSDVRVEAFDFDFRFEFSMTEEGRNQIVVWQQGCREYNGVGLFRVGSHEHFDEKQLAKFNFRRRAMYEETDQLLDVEFEVVRTDDILNDNQVKNADTEMVWLVSNNVDFNKPDFIPFSYDRHYTHNFNISHGDNTIRNGVRLVPRTGIDVDSQKDIDIIAGSLQPIERVVARTVAEAVELATQDVFWMVNPDLELTDKTVDEFYPDLYNTSPTHIFSFESRKGERMGYGGLALANKAYHPENVQYHDEIVARVPDRHNIKKYFTRDPYKAYTQAKKHVFYWVVDTAVDLVEDWDFDFYPDIHSIENVFAFKSEGDGEAGVYLVHRPHLEQFNPSEEDFSFDRFKNIIRVDRVASRVVGHPAFYFDEGMYKANTEHFTEHKNIDVIDATDLAAAYRKAADMTKTGYFWALDNDAEMIDDFERSFYVDRHHKSHFHLWPKENPYTGFIHQFGGLKLIPAAAIKELKPDADKLRKMTFKNKKPVKKAAAATRDIPYDVVFLSYNEPFADQNYAKLLERVPNAKRVHGVKGIFNAHKQAAELADTRMFYVVDADAILLEDFKFEYFPTVWDEDIVHTWKSKNPINDLIYGYGGLKLFPTKLLRDAQDWRIDFTTSVSEKFKPMPIAANYTAFNTDPFNTWKSAFRECTKLSSSIIHRSKQDENDERLEAWCTKGADRQFGEYAIAGANAGREWGAKYSEDDEMLGKINDFAWLEEKFKEQNNGK